MSLRVVGCPGRVEPRHFPAWGQMGSGVRSGLLCWKFCASTATAPLWGRSEVGEGGLLLLELRQVRGELDDQ